MWATPSPKYYGKLLRNIFPSARLWNLFSYQVEIVQPDD